MFTGIITNLGEITDIFIDKLTVKAGKDFIGKLSLGDSISLNGVCLTIADLAKNSFKVDVMPETRRRTALLDLQAGDLVNLELSATMQTSLSGHMVYGHIDGVGTIDRIRKERQSRIFIITTSPKLTSMMVEKGAVSLNGISLTLITVSNGQFSVGIIPYTLTHTMLKKAKVGDKLNIETDIVGKYIKKFITG